MKKIIAFYCGILLFVVANQINAQAFHKGTKILNVGMGLGGYSAYWGTGYSRTPYINAALDFGVYDIPDAKNLSIGIGGYLGYQRTSLEWVSTWRDKNGNWHVDEKIRYSWTYTSIGIRPALYYSFNDQAVIYGGIGLGYVIVDFENHNPYYEPPRRYDSYFGYGVFAGFRYFFSKSIGAYVETGWRISALNLGISFRF